MAPPRGVLENAGGSGGLAKSAPGLRGNGVQVCNRAMGHLPCAARYALPWLQVSYCREDDRTYAPGQALVGKQGSVAREDATGEECTHSNGHPRRMAVIHLVGLGFQETQAHLRGLIHQ